MSTGRLVFPPHPLPTEQSRAAWWSSRRGLVVDVGRMSVLPSYRMYRQAAFVALLCRLYLEMRAHGYAVACGMMSPRVRSLLRQLGLQLEVLGPDRTYWNEPRAPVRFALTVNALSLGRRWSPGPDAAVADGAPSGGPEHQDRVGTAEAEGARQAVGPGRSCAARPTTTSSVHLGVDLPQPGDRRHEALAQGHQGHDGLDRAGPTDHVAGRALRPR